MRDQLPQQGHRALDDWLTSYLEFTENHEAPEIIHFWVGLSVLSAALRRQIYLDRVRYKLYPNIYVIIVAESAKVRKSIAMEMGLDLIKKAVPDIITLSGRVTPEGLVKNMNRVITVNGSDPLHPTIRQESHILLYADELATLIGYDRQIASRMSILLTESYSCKDEYKHITKSDAPIIVKNLYPTLLAATDPRNLKVLPDEAVGGLLGRTIFVSATQRKKKIAWLEDSPELNDLEQKLIVDLARIASLKGTFQPTENARRIYKDWYDKFTDNDIKDARLDAFFQRAPDTALKISMLISVSRSNTLTISDEHMEIAITIIERQLKDFNRSMEWVAATPYAQVRMRVLDLMKRYKGVTTRRAVMRALTLNKDDMDTIQSSLEEEGIIHVYVIKNEILYRLVSKKEQDERTAKVNTTIAETTQEPSPPSSPETIEYFNEEPTQET